jgi:hypothetical protein
VESFDIGSFSEPLQGHRVARGFGHRGQDSFRYPGAREPDRMLLAGWEVSWFGQGLVSASGWVRKKGKEQGKDNQINGGISIRKR